MYNIFLPTRKITKAWRRGFYHRDRLSSLHECLDPASDPRSWRPWLLFLLLVPTVYYLCSHIFNKPNTTYTQYYVPIEDYQSENLVQNKTKGIDHHEPPTTAESPTQKVSDGFPVCVLNKSLLGTTRYIIDKLNATKVHALMNIQYPLVKKGGYYAPPKCRSRHKVGILVPYRDRPTNLAVFMYNIHPFLMNQKLEYRIFVIEQSGTEKFNKGRLYNAGFKEMQKYGKWKCIVFHDVDLLPLDERILYTCPSFPRHMCGSVVEKKADPRFHPLFGGVTSMSLAHYEKVNGYSNMYWGWGGEDNDMFWRLRSSGIPVVRYNRSIARYTSLPHPVLPKNKFRFQLMHTAMERWKEEGVSTVEYKVISVTMRHLYTHILVDVNPYNDNVTVLMIS